MVLTGGGWCFGHRGVAGGGKTATQVPMLLAENKGGEWPENRSGHADLLQKTYGQQGRRMGQVNQEENLE